MSRRKRVRSREDFFESWDQEEQSEFARGVLSIKQRFPGPAGLIPRLENPGVLVDPGTAVSTAVDSIVMGTEASYSPDRSILSLPKEPWRALLSELDLDPNCGLLTLASIGWVEKSYPRLEDKDKNIPFLAAVIEGDPIRGRFQEPLMTVKVMDASGSILVSLDPEIVKAYGASLKKGTALAMFNVQVLRVSSATKMIVLPVSKLICIATLDEGLGVVVQRHNEGFDKVAAEDAFMDLNMKLEVSP